LERAAEDFTGITRPAEQCRRRKVPATAAEWCD
jgi:hypothetical protein